MKNDLMTPRYEVIADYPDSEFGVGDLLTMIYVPKNPTFGKSQPYWYTMDGIGRHYSESSLNKYPHLFRKLSWWEKREKYFWSEGKPSTPLFVSSIGKNIFGTAWGIDIETGFFTIEVNGESSRAHLSNYLPATESEYLSWLNNGVENK